jgi:mutator family transposase
VVKVREDGRVVNVHALVATGVNADGHREILGLNVASAEDGAGGWRFCAGWSPAACPACSGYLRCPRGQVLMRYASCRSPSLSSSIFDWVPLTSRARSPSDPPPPVIVEPD